MPPADLAQRVPVPGTAPPRSLSELVQGYAQPPDVKHGSGLHSVTAQGPGRQPPMIYGATFGGGACQVAIVGRHP
jgi:hypothetical protein